MTFEILLTFSILIGVLAVFTLDLFPPDFVAFSTLAVILGLGPILGVGPEEAISGFSNPATVTVMAMFILSGAIERTGVINLFVHRLVHFVGKGELRQLVSIALIVGPISAFINNTAAVAILMPVVITLARAHQRSPSKLLIPLSYLSQLAGVVTLIGTSTNILASTLSAREGYGTFGMFEFSQIGLLVFVTGTGYLLIMGRWLLPDRRLEPEIIKNYQMKEYLTEVIVLDGSPLIGKTIVAGRLREQFDMHVLEILRNGHKLSHPLSDHFLQADDILFVKINPSQLVKITKSKNLAIVSEVQADWPRLSNKNMAVLEVVIGPGSDLIGGTLESTIFRHHYNCSVIAVRKHGEILRERLGEVHLNFGDTLLLRGTQSALEQIKREPGFILAIMFAVSNSFATPVGYQTNTMVYGPGGYKFLDFVRVGLPLNVLMAIATPLYIYFLWGL